VTDSLHLMRRAGVKVKRPTKAQRRAPVYILPSYVGVATDKYGKVIS
jgi:hypothetical protein